MQSSLVVEKNHQQFLTSIAHEVRSPLGVVYNSAELLKIDIEKRLSGEVLAEFLQHIENIKNSTKEALGLVNDLLDNKFQQKADFSLGVLEECNLADLLQDILVVNAYLFGRNKVSLKTVFAENLPNLTCDLRRMRQIFTNIITNAVKYSPANTLLTISLDYLATTDQIYIEFSDQGIGMNEEEIAMALSGNGQKIDKSELRKENESHGIGMTIVKKLVELHKGKLLIESQKSVGTKVKLYFFVDKKYDLPLGNSMANQIIEKQNNFKPKSVLVAEDNKVCAKIICKTFENAGHQVHLVEDGAQAVKKLDEQNFDLVLMDGSMPLLDGYSATKMIREGSCFKQFRDYRQIPIIIFTANSYCEVEKQIKESGASGYINKSSPIHNWLEAVNLK